MKRVVIFLIPMLVVILAAPWILGNPQDDKRAKAPEWDGAVGYINTDKPLKLADLKGKIVLMDFWTFG